MGPISTTIGMAMRVIEWVLIRSKDIIIIDFAHFACFWEEG